jgi:hypothetical protein
MGVTPIVFWQLMRGRKCRQGGLFSSCGDFPSCRLLRSRIASASRTSKSQKKENPMREFLEDLIGCLCLFAMIPGLWFLLYGFGW